MKHRFLGSGALGVAAITLLPAAALAGTVDIGGGWQASWDDTLDGLVQISSDGVSEAFDAVFIEKSAEFTQGPVFGQYPTIAITFTQISADAVSNIVIDDEIVTNSTGTDWAGFEMKLLDSGNAWFDTGMTAASGGGGPIGFSINPFTTAVFSDSDTRLTMGGGTVADGSQWLPGGGATDGQLWIATNLGDGINTPFTTFTLKETPLPGPAVLACVGIGMMFSRRTRRG